MKRAAVAVALRSSLSARWPRFTGRVGGAAAFDCDGSGFLSVFVARGKNPAKLFVNKSTLAAQALCLGDPPAGFRLTPLA